jgi:hydrogenase maturation protein HypF
MAVADKFSVQRLAFSGGVFQNALLVDMIIEFMNEKNTLYWHKEFSPNDEGIAFGQLMYFLQNKVTL